ncbi:Peroxiredoxin [Mucilaginibacter pineti]|uniref:Peroxiredoxin n=1 Tax=Mucilaginibacter pineti TaxID=1391627 RepID=A0A1G7HU18_9SPHI|nr:TlpA disulfide reductase family protein [Mucilaginibacter pineti]SDF03828.1 Peroxiredoxin [Mucilaginibacter pineti]
MKNRIIAACVLLLTVFAFSCKNSSTFTINGELKNPGTIKLVYLVENDSTGLKVVDSTTLGEGGKFQFKHSSTYANFYKLRIGTNGSGEMAGAASNVYDLIAKNGDDIEFTTDNNDAAHAYTIKGSDESGKIQEFNKLSNVYASKNIKLGEQYQAKLQAEHKQVDSPLLKVLLPIYQKNIEDLSDATLKFVNDNKHSLAGFYAATSLDPIKYEPQLITYSDAIKGTFDDNPGIQQFIKQMEKVKVVAIGHKAPDFTVAGIDGKPIKLSDYKGKYVMLDFWASWCAPCRQENPNVVKQYAKFNSKGLNILGISLDKEKKDWQKAINDDKLTWQHGSDLNGFEGATERLYHIEAIPSNFIIDPQGNIAAKNITGTDLEAFLNKTFK